MSSRRWVTTLIAILLGTTLLGCGSRSSGNGSNQPPTIDPTFARQAGAGIQNVLGEVARVARGAVLLQGRVRPAAYPSGPLPSESRSTDQLPRAATAPGPCPAITSEGTDEGFIVTIEYGPAPGCVDAFDGLARTGTLTLTVTDLVYDATQFAPISGHVALSVANFRIGDTELSGSGRVDIVSLTLESWDLDLTSRGPTGSQHLSFQGIVTSELLRDAETINGTGVLTSGAGGIQVTVSALTYDFDNGETSFVCDDPIGGDLTLTSTTVATLHFGYPAPGCGFVDLTIDQQAPSRVSIDERPRPGDPAALVIGVERAPTPAVVGEDLTYTVTVFNAGNDATGVVLSNVLPLSVRWVSSIASQGACTGTLTVTCIIGDLPRLGRAVVTIVGVPTAPGWFENVAGVTGNESEADTADNTFVTWTLVVGRGEDPGPSGVDLVLAVAADPSPVLTGQDVTYTLTVSNQGEQTATGVVLLDTIPSYYAQWVSSATTQGECSGNAPVTCSLGSLAPGAQATVTIVVTMLPYGGLVSNFASVSSTAADDVPLNNTVTFDLNVLTPVQTPARIEITPTSAFALGIGSTKQFSAAVYSDGVTYPQYYGAVAWSSSDETVVTINASGVATARAAGTASITASAGGVTSPAVSVTVEEVRTIELPTNDLVYDAGTRRLYVSVPSRAGVRGNTVTAIDPATGTILWSEFVGSEPGKLALSGDGRWLYVALDGATGVQRFDVTNRVLDIQFSLGRDQNNGAYRAGDMKVLPSQPGSVAVSRTFSSFGGSAGVAVYDDGVQRPTTTASFSTINTLAFSNLATTLYAFGSYTLQTLSVDSTGVSVSTTTNNLISVYDTDMRFAGGRLYFSTGQVVNPVTTELTGTFLLTDAGYYPYSGSVEPDVSAGRTYFLLDSGTSRLIKAFDQQTFRPLGTLEIQGGTQASLARPTGSLRRWGTNGLAYRANSDQVVLVRTALVP